MAQILANELPNDGIEWAKLCAADMLAMGLHWPMLACRLLHASSRAGPNYNPGKCHSAGMGRWNACRYDADEVQWPKCRQMSCLTLASNGPNYARQICSRWACIGQCWPAGFFTQALAWAQIITRGKRHSAGLGLWKSRRNAADELAMAQGQQMSCRALASNGPNYARQIRS